VVFQTDITNSNLKNQLWRYHRYYVTEKRHQSNVTKFFHLRPSYSKFLGTPVSKL